jgi:hypothetical protein
MTARLWECRMRVDVFDDADSAARAAAARSQRMLALRWLAMVGSSWLSVVDARRGSCYEHSHAKTSHGTAFMWCRWTSASPASGDPERNLTRLRESLLQRSPLTDEQIHPMSVERRDLDAAAKEYEQVLREVAGVPPLLDLGPSRSRPRRPHRVSHTR